MLYWIQKIPERRATVIVKKPPIELTSAALHILAMLFMFCDHLWATVVPGNQWLNAVGRLAFPIFAFMIVEGYFHTSNLQRYILRLLAFAILSEIPFNLMCGSNILYPLHQNVMWTFLLGLLMIHMNEQAKKAGSLWRRILVGAVSIPLGAMLGLVTMVDYYSAGVLTVLVFYFFRGRKWWCFLGQVVSLYYLNVEVLSGLFFPISLFGVEFELVQQGLALLALLPIWLYRGQKGHHSKAFQYFCYAFYPAHILILALLHMC